MRAHKMGGLQKLNLAVSWTLKKAQYLAWQGRICSIYHHGPCHHHHLCKRIPIHLKNAYAKLLFFSNRSYACNFFISNGTFGNLIPKDICQKICITAFCNNLYMLEILHFCNKNSLCCGYTGPTDPTLWSENSTTQWMWIHSIMEFSVSPNVS